jgi:hypothetical protein
VIFFLLRVFESPRCQADDVQFALSGFTSGAATNRQVLVTPLALYPPADQAVTYDPVLCGSGSSGAFIISNMIRGLYRADIQAPPARTSFAFFVETNGTGGPLVSVDRLQRATPAEVRTPQDYAFSAQASDARYIKGGDLPGLLPGLNIVTQNAAGVILRGATIRPLSSGQPSLTLTSGAGGEKAWQFDGDGHLTGIDAGNTNIWLDPGGGDLTNAGHIVSGAGFVGDGTRLVLSNNGAIAGLTEQIGTKLTAAGGTGTGNTLVGANIPAGDLIISYVFDNQHPINIWMLASCDYTNWDYVSKTPIFKSTVPYLGAFAGGFYRDPRPFVYNGTNYISFLVDNQNAVLFESVDLINWKTNQVLNQPLPLGRAIRWEPHWFIDTNNVLYCYTSQAGPGQDAFAFYTNFIPYVMYLTNLSDMRSWSAQTPVSGTWWSNSIAPEVVRNNGLYWMFQTQEGTPSFNTNAFTCVSVATNPLGPWSLILTNDWAGWGALAEGAVPFRMSNGDWILYSCKYGGGGNFAATCPASGFPTNGWSARQLMPAPYGFDDPGYLLITNLVIQNAIFRYQLSKKNLEQPIHFWGDTYQTVSYGGNIWNKGTNFGWNQLDSFYTNLYGMQILFDTYNGAWFFETLGKGGLKGPGWDNPATAPSIKPSGFNVGGSVMGISSVTSGKFIMTNCTTLPTMIGNDVVYVTSNKVVYGVSSTKTNLVIDLR